MSIVDRLFPASELEHLRASPYDFDLEAPMVKRRKLSSSQSSVSSNKRRASSDSGYSSDETASSLPESSQPSRKRSRPSLSSASSSPPVMPMPVNHSTLFRKYCTSMDSSSRAHHRLRTQSDMSSLFTEDLKQFHSQIAHIPRESRHSVSSLPTPPYANGGSSRFPPAIDEASHQTESCVRDIGQGWTAGPKSAAGHNVSARLLDGMRITSHERSLISSLIPEAYTQRMRARPEFDVTPTFTYPQRRPSQIMVQPPIRSSFAGIAMPTFDDDEDDIVRPDLDGLDLGEAVNVGSAQSTCKMEDFFNIEEASDDTVSDDTDAVKVEE